MASDDIYDKKKNASDQLVDRLFGSGQPKAMPDYSNSQANMAGLERGFGYAPQMDQPAPAFPSTKNFLKAKDNSDMDSTQADLDKRKALLNQPRPISSTVPSPYMQPKDDMMDLVKKQYGQQPVAGGMPMQQPSVQATNNPSMNNNPPLDNEDLKALGLLPK